MDLLAALANGPAIYTGAGTNHEGEAFTARLHVSKLVGGKALLLTYVATVDGGEVIHEESTLLSTNDEEDLCLWPVLHELPFVLPHPEFKRDVAEDGTIEMVFASGPRSDVDIFREEISISVAKEGNVLYSHAWGMPGGRFEARSTCRFVPSEA